MMLQNHLNYLQMTHQSDALVDQFTGLQHVFSTHMNGYSGHFSPSTIEEMRKMPEVDFIEKDQIVKTLEIEAVDELSVQRGAPWVSHDRCAVLCQHSSCSFSGSRSYQSPPKAHFRHFHEIRI